MSLCSLHEAKAAKYETETSEKTTSIQVDLHGSCKVGMSALYDQNLEVNRLGESCVMSHMCREGCGVDQSCNEFIDMPKLSSILLLRGDS